MRDAGRGMRETTPPLPLILCYHKIEARRELGVTRLSPRRFAAQMERLAAAGWRAIGADALLAIVSGAAEPGAKELVITFDDAYRGLREHAFPVLESLGWPSLCFAITEFAGRLNRWDVAYGGRRFAHLSWRDMRRWEMRGVSFGSHTATHPRLTWLGGDALRRELESSRHGLAAGCDAPVDLLSYPFGAAGHRERAAAQDAGYLSAFGLARRPASSAFDLPRLPVYTWSPPIPGAGPLASAEWLVARATNGFAVGTTIIRSMLPA
jgi:peptidoglycan/xylan/chitin deacetylase (PgdA/CDA1 family)